MSIKIEHLFIEGIAFEVTRKSFEPQTEADETEFSNRFACEYEHMTQLEQTLGTEAYRRLFPRYVSYETEAHPSITFEHIEGETLEHTLIHQAKFGTSPFQHLTRQQMWHVMKQIDEAQHALLSVGMLQMDLNPSNIIIRNKEFDISLIDFTHACYMEDPKFHSNYRCIDQRISRIHWSLDVQLQRTAADLFSRLFYKGNTCFKYPTLEICRNSQALRQYISLICFSLPENPTQNITTENVLSYWEQWYGWFDTCFRDLL